MNPTPSRAHPRARPMSRSVAWALAAFLLGPAAGHGQPSGPLVIRPGDGQIDGRRIPVYEFAWQSYRIAADGGRTPLAVWHDTVSVVDGDGGSVLRRVQRVVPQKGPVTTLLNDADRETLRPLRTVARRGDDEPFIDLRFEGRRLTGHRPFLPRNAAPGESVPVRIEMDFPEPLYDWRWWGLLVAAQPLTPGYASRFLAFATEANVEPFLLWVTARVAGEEAVGDVPCWRVEVEAGAPWTFWIAKRRDQPPVQRIRIAQPNGDLVVWEPLDARR